MTFGVLNTFTINTTNLSITLMDLEEYVEYNISVRAYTSVGPGPYTVGINRTSEDGKFSRVLLTTLLTNIFYSPWWSSKGFKCCGFVVHCDSNILE